VRHFLRNFHLILYLLSRVREALLRFSSNFLWCWWSIIVDLWPSSYSIWLFQVQIPPSCLTRKAVLLPLLSLGDQVLAGSGRFPEKQQVSECATDCKTQTVEQLSTRHQTVLATFLRFRKPLYSCTRPGTSYHVTQFYQAFPRVSIASDERWGEKA